MYFSDLTASLRRRKWLVLVAILISAGLCVGASSVLKPTYESQANVVLIPPDSTVAKGGNPYLYLGNLGQAVDVLIRAANSDEARTAVTADAPDGIYEVSPDWTTSAPMMILTVKAATSDQVSRLQKTVLEQIPVSLTQLQDDLDVPVDSRIGTKVVSSDAEPRADVKSKIRMLAIIAIGSLFLMFLMIAAYDNLRLRLARRKAARAGGLAAPAVPVDASAAEVTDGVPAPQSSKRRAGVRSGA